MTEEYVARLEGVSHHYGSTTAVDEVSLALPAGRMLGIIGPDGVGKTSVLALIAGARAIQTGDVELLGGTMRDKRHRAHVQPRIAYMPQGLGRNLYPTLSVYENVDFFARLYGQDRHERAARIEHLLRATGLLPFADRPAAKLSGGMKQKLGLCCALIHDPEFMILDEPTTGVDPLSRRQFWQLIDEIRAAHPGMSVLVATAYMEEAARFDWLVAMDAGRIIGSGTPAELLERTGTNDLEAAFVALLPEEKRGDHSRIEIPPLQAQDGDWAIEAEGLTQRFGEFVAVDHVSFRIRRGEIFGFLGSNGCGKTTTMKMLTGLLPPTDGHAELFGSPVDAHAPEARRQVGYMSQGFSLYTELTVRENLILHAQLFHLTAARTQTRIAELVERFGLAPYMDARAESLPLGIRQRLSLAVAIVHSPRLLILDEPTSGVDPVARDGFWELLVELSREQGTTIFISTHFMNEAERCDRVSLMHAGRVLASDTPAALVEACGASTLEDAFIRHLEEATPAAAEAAPIVTPGTSESSSHQAPPFFSLRRLLAYAWREALELRRDAIRLTFALAGSLMLMIILGYGISMDVQDLRFAVLDNDHSPESRSYVQNFTGSPYFIEQPPVKHAAEIEERMKSSDIALAIEIPPNFGRDLRRGRQPEIALWVDGAMPYRGEMIRGYAEGLHQLAMQELAAAKTGTVPAALPARIQLRYRYNQDFKSLYAMVPAVIPLQLIFIPAILMALAVVREKELGSITNLYVTPVTRFEFLLGKQLPYVAVAMVSFYSLVAAAVFLFGVPLKGSLLALSFAALLYVISTTGIGLLMSTFTKTQIAALAITAVATMLPTTQFSGLTTPVTSLEGAGYWIGKFFPPTYFLVICRGLFTKAVEIQALYSQYLALAAFIPVLWLVCVALLKKQEA